MIDTHYLLTKSREYHVKESGLGFYLIEGGEDNPFRHRLIQREDGYNAEFTGRGY